ncbi:5-oxoprolinase subunit PxpA [Thalassotalea fusca]
MVSTSLNGVFNRLTLNCDLGESYGSWKMGNDAEIMPYIDCANIACGFHAGDPNTMSKTIAQALAHNVTIGAHPGYPDKEGFGRRSIAYDRSSLITMIIYQVGALQALCRHHQGQVAYIKPHGALYNDMMANTDIFESVAMAAKSLSLPLMMQALPPRYIKDFITIGKCLGVALIFEGFADRNYQSNGKLVPRSKANAVVHDIPLVVQRCKDIKEGGVIMSEDGSALSLSIDSLCVHGDTAEALTMVKELRAYLDSCAA